MLTELIRAVEFGLLSARPGYSFRSTITSFLKASGLQDVSFAKTAFMDEQSLKTKESRVSYLISAGVDDSCEVVHTCPVCQVDCEGLDALFTHIGGKLHANKLSETQVNAEIRLSLKSGKGFMLWNLLYNQCSMQNA